MAKKKDNPDIDPAALADEVAEMEALVKRRKKLKAQLSEDEGADIDPSMVPLPGSELIDQVLAELNGEGGFSVTKLDGSKTVDMGEYDLPLWPDAMKGVVAEHGGGTYVLVFRRPDGTIAKRIKRTYPASLYPAPVKEVSQGSGDMLAMLKMMEERDARREAQNETLRLESMRGQQQMMTAMMQMMGAQNKPMVNNAAELATIAKLFGAGEKRGSGLEDLVALKDLLDDLRGDPADAGVKIETDSPLVALLAPILQALGRGLNAPAKPAAPAPAAPRPALENTAPPVPATVADLPPKPSPAPTGVPSPAPEASGLLQYANTLVTAIQAGATPEFASSTTWADARKRDLVADLVTLIESGDWEGLKRHSDLVNHTPWIDAFRECLRAGVVAENVAAVGANA